LLLGCPACRQRSQASKLTSARNSPGSSKYPNAMASTSRSDKMNTVGCGCLRGLSFWIPSVLIPSSTVLPTSDIDLTGRVASENGEPDGRQPTEGQCFCEPVSSSVRPLAERSPEPASKTLSEVPVYGVITFLIIHSRSRREHLLRNLRFDASDCDTDSSPLRCSANDRAFPRVSVQARPRKGRFRHSDRAEALLRRVHQRVCRILSN
jgi:hypothetical protein